MSETNLALAGYHGVKCLLAEAAAAYVGHLSPKLHRHVNTDDACGPIQVTYKDPYDVGVNASYFVNAVLSYAMVKAGATSDMLGTHKTLYVSKGLRRIYLTHVGTDIMWPSHLSRRSVEIRRCIMDLIKSEHTDYEAELDRIMRTWYPTMLRERGMSLIDENGVFKMNISSPAVMDLVVTVEQALAGAGIDYLVLAATSAMLSKRFGREVTNYTSLMAPEQRPHGTAVGAPDHDPHRTKLLAEAHMAAVDAYLQRKNVAKALKAAQMRIMGEPEKEEEAEHNELADMLLEPPAEPWAIAEFKGCTVETEGGVEVSDHVSFVWKNIASEESTSTSSPDVSESTAPPVMVKPDTFYKPKRSGFALDKIRAVIDEYSMYLTLEDLNDLRLQLVSEIARLFDKRHLALADRVSSTKQQMLDADKEFADAAQRQKNATDRYTSAVAELEAARRDFGLA